MLLHISGAAINAGWNVKSGEFVVCSLNIKGIYHGEKVCVKEKLRGRINYYSNININP